MRLLQKSNTAEFSFTKDFVGDTPVPPYAILSHTWKEGEEVTYRELIDGTGKSKSGYHKIQFCGVQAELDGLQYFWVDTCCINKENSSEVSQAINSMFRWYRNANRCYVYLPDVSSPPSDTKEVFNPQSWDSEFWNSKWFTRGWTLQELLAPRIVEFFSREGKRLGGKLSLKQQIYEITGVPESALQGALLSQFSVDERFLWIERRQTKLEEDKVYSLLGIFGVEIPLFYGEGATNAFKRLREVIDKREKCIQDLRLTDPRDDKKRIENTKGGLLEDSCHWIFESSEFQLWCRAEQSQLLWIKGDPGKGKTMLLCSIINELKRSSSTLDLLSYFFCQATDSRINNATAVLRGLIYLVVDQQPSLVSHVQKKYDRASKMLFEDANAWIALSEIFANILQDPKLKSAYIVVDALDECVDLPKLLDFIIQILSICPRIKWVVSSRNWPSIEKDLNNAVKKERLCLELNEKSVSAAVATYIQFKVDWLARRNRYSNDVQEAVHRYLSLNANGTFLWVALVCQELSNISGWKAKQKLMAFPPGLDALYGRMMDQITDSEDAEVCKHVLAVVSAVYRPITLDELASFVHVHDGAIGGYEALSEIIGLCGSFLTFRGRTVSFVHQSAKDYLLAKKFDEIFPSGIEETHHEIFSRSLDVMSKTLKRDIYGLGMLGYPITLVKQPDPDPLAASRYSCIYWVDHMCEWDLDCHTEQRADLQDRGIVDLFVREKFLYWLEALSLCRSVPKGVLIITKLEGLIQSRTGGPVLLELVRDARRFIMYHKQAIQISPLQAYASALVFSPASSLIKRHFKKEESGWITIKPAIKDEWSSCLQTLEGHSDIVELVVFSHDSIRLASASYDGTIRIWDASSGACLQTLEGNSGLLTAVAFTRNLTQLATVSHGGTISIRDASSGACLQTLNDRSDWVQTVVFSHDSAWLASASYYKTITIWDVSSSKCLQILKGHGKSVVSVTFSHNSTQLASASEDSTVRIWDASSGACLQIFRSHSSSVAFSHDSSRLASASKYTITIWNASNGEFLQSLQGHIRSVTAVAWSPDSTRLVSASFDTTVRIWDASSGACLQTLEGHSGFVNSVAFSHDSTRLASASEDSTVKVWDARSDTCMWTPKGHSGIVNSVTFSHDSTRFASGSYDNRIKIWDTNSGKCLQTFRGHSEHIYSVAFSHDSTRLASSSVDSTVRIWDTSSGACLRVLKDHSNSVLSVAFSHDSALIASASRDGTIRTWDGSSYTCLQTFKDHSEAILSVAFSHNSAWLASGSYENIIKIWDVSSGSHLQTFEGHSESVISLAFSHDSAWLASASYDKTMRIWDVSSGKCLQTLTIGKALRDISFDATGLYIHTDIGTIAIGAPSDKIETQDPRYRGVGLSASGDWITYNSKNFVWLPSEYRPGCSAVSGRTIGIGVGSGKVWMCDVDYQL